MATRHADIAHYHDFVVVERAIAGKKIDRPLAPREVRDAVTILHNRGWLENAISRHLKIRAPTIRTHLDAISPARKDP
jgi:hypothetical protein